MNAQLKEALGTATDKAFEEYKRLHPALADFLETCEEDIFPELVESIEYDPESLKALEVAHAENRVKDIVELVMQYLPGIIGRM